VSAWQHPTDRCPFCGQDILLRPEVTADIRLVYVQYCPACDAGEAMLTAGFAAMLDENSLWAPSEQPATVVSLGDRTAAAAPLAARAANSDVDLWWDGDSDRADQSLRGLEARWAAFAPADADEDDDEPMAADGSFSFGTEELPQRRQRRFGLRPRQSA